MVTQCNGAHYTNPGPAKLALFPKYTSATFLGKGVKILNADGLVTLYYYYLLYYYSMIGQGSDKNLIAKLKWMDMSENEE